jgi:hypothetical protein
VTRKIVKSEISIEDAAGGGAPTGTQTAYIEGIHGNLFINVALAYYCATRRPAAFTGNTFKLYQWTANRDGGRTPLSPTPINGASGQAAPDAWEGTTNLDTLQLDHAYQGQAAAADAGRWEIVVTMVAAINMCEADFVALANAVSIRVVKKSI